MICEIDKFKKMHIVAVNIGTYMPTYQSSVKLTLMRKDNDNDCDIITWTRIWFLRSALVRLTFS